VYLVDEFRTSCKCSKCDGGVCEKFMVRKNPRPNKDDMRLVHGLLHCKNGCGEWNRDRNGSSNIYKIAYQSIYGLERPGYLCRTSNQSASTSAYNQNIYKKYYIYVLYNMLSDTQPTQLVHPEIHSGHFIHKCIAR